LKENGDYAKDRDCGDASVGARRNEQHMLALIPEIVLISPGLNVN
jgi:hypothetical protein